MPQSIPAGELVTVPLPTPDRFTVRAKVFKSKFAVTDLAASMVTEQGAVPEQAPVQPVKMESAAGVALRVTEVLLV